ncbi:MAG: YggT family protein, partial [Halothiobacillus sp.]|nr:YggT family protein [Halothiobacillus sp.]
VVMVRYFLQLFHANFFNPITQSLVKLTNPVLSPLRNVLPKSRRHDFASLLVTLVLIVLMVWVLGMMSVGRVSVAALIFNSLYFAFLLVTDLFFWTILMRAIASWIGNGRSPGVALLEDLTDPILQPVQKILPPLGGIDLSPLAVLIAIQVLQIFVGNLLMG